MSTLLKNKIKQYLKYKGISETKFQQKLHLPIGFLDSNETICVDKLRAIAKAYTDLNLEWLIANTGNMIKSKPDAEDPSLLLIVEEKSTQLEKIIYENERLMEELKAIKKGALGSIATTMIYMRSKEA